MCPDCMLAGIHSKLANLPTNYAAKQLGHRGLREPCVAPDRGIKTGTVCPLALPRQAASCFSASASWAVRSRTACTSSRTVGCFQHALCCWLQAQRCCCASASWAVRSHAVRSHEMLPPNSDGPVPLTGQYCMPNECPSLLHMNNQPRSRLTSLCRTGTPSCSRSHLLRTRQVGRGDIQRRLGLLCTRSATRRASCAQKRRGTGS